MQITIQKAVLKRGKTLYQLSTDLDIPFQTVYGWHKFNRVPNQKYLDLICQYLQCAISEVLVPEKPDYSL